MFSAIGTPIAGKLPLFSRINPYTTTTVRITPLLLPKAYSTLWPLYRLCN